jgi:AI-2 transport protein TqsA
MTGYDTPAAASGNGSHRALRLAVGAAAVVVLLLGLSQLSRIVGPFFLALNLMIVVWPVQHFLARRMPRALAAVLSGVLAIVIIGLLFWAIGWAASLFVQEIPQYKGQFQSMYEGALNVASQFGVTSSQIVDQLKGVDPGSVVRVVSSLISNVGSALSLFVVVITVLLFMVVDSVDFEARLERLGRRHDPVVVLALESFAQGVRRYWVTSTVFGLIVSVLTWVGLAAYGIPLAVVWAVLAFVTNYIPNVGFVLGLVPAAVMGLLAKGPWGALFVIVLYAVLNFVIQGVLQPKVAGEAVGVTSTVSFLSLLVWAVVLGPLGALLALPATLFVKALVVDADPRAWWLNALIASNPRTSSEEPLLGPAEDVEAHRLPASMADEPAGEEPISENPVNEEPVGEETSAEESVTNETSDEKPVPVETPAEESLAAERAAEEPADEMAVPEPATTDEVAADVTDNGQDDEPKSAPSDLPRRARLDDARFHEDESRVADDRPVFQKSATPYWPGAMSSIDD